MGRLGDSGELGFMRYRAGRHYIQALLLLVLMGGFMALLGSVLWGVQGALWLLAAVLIFFMFSGQGSTQWLMRLKGAQPLAADRSPILTQALEVLAQRAQLPVVPQLYYVQSPVMNAFAVGDLEDSAVAVTDGALRQLTFHELLGVLAHELSHIQHHDLRVMGLANLFSFVTRLLSGIGQILLLISLPMVLMGMATVSLWAIVLLIMAPSLSALAQLALSRSREYDADLGAVELTGDPESLAQALVKIENAQQRRWFWPGTRPVESRWLRTHPLTADRVERLMALKARYTPVFKSPVFKPSEVVTYDVPVGARRWWPFDPFRGH